MANQADNSVPSTESNSVLTTDIVRALGLQAGLAAVGVTSADVLEPARSVLTLRKEQGLAGEMQFTYRNPERSTSPGLLIDNAQSLIAGAYRYPHKQAAMAPMKGRIARYATDNFYAELEDGLEVIADKVRGAGFQARVIADQNGLVDRNVAWSAGLGSYGKNANILLPEVGSWFVLGAVVTDAELTTTGPPVNDQCGPCTRCIDECPTQAIVAPGVVDANRCIAWLVQSDGIIPNQFREAIGDRLYGCDECQEVCPPNRSIGVVEENQDQTTPSTVDLEWILSATDDEILDRHGRWYIARRDVDNIRRTALIVLGNVAEPTDDAKAIIQTLRRYIANDNPTLRSHAVWSARRLGLDQLLPPAASELDVSVAAEYSASSHRRFQPSEWPIGL